MNSWSEKWGTFTVIWLTAVFIGLLVTVLTRPHQLCGNGRVTLTCPFSDPSLNREFLGRPIVQITRTGTPTSSSP